MSIAGNKIMLATSNRCHLLSAWPVVINVVLDTPPTRLLHADGIATFNLFSKLVNTGQAETDNVVSYFLDVEFKVTRRRIAFRKHLLMTQINHAVQALSDDAHLA